MLFHLFEIVQGHSSLLSNKQKRRQELLKSFKHSLKYYNMGYKELLKMRTFLAYFNLVNFLVMIFVTLYMVYSFWGQLQEWWLAIYTYYVILGCSGVVLSLWISLDGKRLTHYSVKLRNLEKKIIELEKKIRLIKR